MGRPKKKIEDEIDLQIVENAGELGLIDVELGILLGVTERTINRYKKNEAFLSALKRGKMKADNEVVKSLYKRAIGYEYTEEAIEYVADKSVDKDGNIVGTPKIKSVKRTKKHVMPDTLAATVWLNNRRPETWKRYGKESENEDSQQWQRLLEIAHSQMVSNAGAGSATSGNNQV